MKRIAQILALTLAAASLYACAHVPQRSERKFPAISVPGVVSETQEAASYMAWHYWDRFLSEQGGPWVCDSLHIAGVSSEVIIAGVREYALFLGMAPDGAEALSSLVSKIEAFQAADTLSNVYPALTDLLRTCLYDANSEMRDEDLYGPFAAALAESGMTPEDMRTSYRYEASMCALNAKGTPAADFRFCDIKGREHRLYDYTTPYTLVLFVNPGCHACEETVDLFGSGDARALVNSGTLTVISVYIDEDLDEWRTKIPSMPDFWINGYDPDFIIRRDLIYNVRAIPSVYLLDASHTVLLKDAVPAIAANMLFGQK